MNALIFTLLAIAAAALMFVALPASLMARIIRYGIPGILVLAGIGLSLLGRTALGAMSAMIGITLWKRLAGTIPPRGWGGGAGDAKKVSTVRSAALEMELNHETGTMNGLVLVGRFEGEELEQLHRDDLMVLRDEIRDDAESLALLDAYLDRRFAGWREDAHFDAGTGEVGSTRSGPMGEEEAYEVLGLAPGAGIDEIRKAHRRLMKRAHPDSGGSTFLAAKINEAKDVLLKSHS